MSYIGTPPSNAFTSLLKQDFSTSATTGYTLDHAVNNANDIALFINFVRQEPTAGYAASGTTLTLTSATASSDDMYCVYLGQALQTVNPPNASVGTSQLVDGAVTYAKASGFGKVLQVIGATDSTTRNTTSSSFVTASNTLSVNITPSSTSNKIFIIVNAAGYINATGDANYTIYRGSTNLGGSNGMTAIYNETAAQINSSVAMSYLDSPSSTSQLTYQVYFKTAAGTAYLNYPSVTASITTFEIAG